MKKKTFYFIPLLLLIIILLYRILNWRINYPQGKIGLWLVITTLICLISPVLLFFKKRTPATIALYVSIFLVVVQMLGCVCSAFKIKSIKNIQYISGSRFISLIRSYPYKSTELMRLENLLNQFDRPGDYWEKEEDIKEREKIVDDLKKRLEETREKTKKISRYQFLRIFDEGACIVFAILCLIFSIKNLNEFPKENKKNILFCKKCGCRIINSWTYCRNCGNMVRETL